MATRFGMHPEARMEVTGLMPMATNGLSMPVAPVGSVGSSLLPKVPFVIPVKGKVTCLCNIGGCGSATSPGTIGSPSCVATGDAIPGAGLDCGSVKGLVPR